MRVSVICLAALALAGCSKVESPEPAAEAATVASWTPSSSSLLKPSTTPAPIATAPKRKLSTESWDMPGSDSAPDEAYSQLHRMAANDESSHGYDSDAGWRSASDEETPAYNAAPAAKDTASLAAAGHRLKDLGKFLVTFYWVAYESNYSGPRNTPVYGKRGKLLGRFRKGFVKEMRMEGTGETLEGERLNVAGGGRFQVVASPTGIGSSGRALTAYHSIAVDTSIIPLGAKLFIREAQGIHLPDGSIHDGFFYADDTGGAIEDQHIDLFSFHKEFAKLFSDAGIKSGEHVTVYRVDAPETPKRRGRRRRVPA